MESKIKELLREIIEIWEWNRLNTDIEAIVESIIPQKILKNISPDEKIFLNLKTEHKPIMNYIFQVSFLIISIMMIYLIIRFLFTTSIFGIIFTITMIGFFSFGLLIILISTRKFIKKDLYHLIISNEKIYFYTKKQISIPENYHIFELNLLKSILCYEIKQKKDSRFYGTIEFITEEIRMYEDKFKYAIRNVPDVSHILNIIESILWHYGSVEERFKELKSRENFQYPLSFHAHGETLTLKEEGIEFSDSIFIPFSENIQFKIIRKIDPSEPAQPYLRSHTRRFGSILGVISIKPNYDSEEEVRFGPIKEYLEIIERIYYSFCVWKEKQKLLKSPKEISRLEIKPIERRDTKLVIPEYRVEISDDISLKIKDLINRQEKIVYTYIPSFNYKTETITFILGFAGLIFIILQFILFGMTVIMITCTIVGFFLLAFCLMSLFSLSFKIPFNNSISIFTTEKLIVLLKNKTNIIHYSNINSISYNEIKKYYNVEINLNEPLLSSPFLDKSKVTLPIYPKSDEILEIILNIINNAITA